MRSIFSRLFLLLLLAGAAFGQCQLPCLNIDKQVKGSVWPAFGTDSGTANAYVVTTVAPLGPGLKPGSRFVFFAAHSNTGASTLNIYGPSSTGAKTIKKWVAGSQVDLASGDIVANQPVDVIYDGSTYYNILGLGAVTTGQLPTVTLRRPCMIVVGADNGSALANADLGPQLNQCFVPFAATVVEIEVTADAGTPNVIVQRSHLGTPTALLSSALATASAGAVACSNTGGTTGLDGTTTCTNTLQNTSVAAGDWIGLTSGTAGGVAKRMTIAVTMTVN